MRARKDAVHGAFAALTLTLSWPWSTSAQSIGDQVMRFACFSSRLDGKGERMEHDVLIDITATAVSDNKVLFRDRARNADGTLYFVTAAPGGARWGVISPDGRTVFAEFRVDAGALTYGFFPMGTLMAAGPCQRNNQ